jgi:hypothetical protein
VEAVEVDVDMASEAVFFELVPFESQLPSRHTMSVPPQDPMLCEAQVPSQRGSRRTPPLPRSRSRPTGDDHAAMWHNPRPVPPCSPLPQPLTPPCHVPPRSRKLGESLTQAELSSVHSASHPTLSLNSYQALHLAHPCPQGRLVRC